MGKKLCGKVLSFYCEGRRRAPPNREICISLPAYLAKAVTFQRVCGMRNTFIALWGQCARITLSSLFSSIFRFLDFLSQFLDFSLLELESWLAHSRIRLRNSSLWRFVALESVLLLKLVSMPFNISPLPSLLRYMSQGRRLSRFLAECSQRRTVSFWQSRAGSITRCIN